MRSLPRETLDIHAGELAATKAHFAVRENPQSFLLSQSCTFEPRDDATASTISTARERRSRDEHYGENEKEIKRSNYFKKLFKY